MASRSGDPNEHQRPGVPVEPVPVRDVIDRVLGHLGGVSREPLDLIFGGWDSLVGEPYAGRSQPQSLRDGILVVVVDDPALASRLKWSRKDLIERFEQVTPGAVRRIDIRVTRSGL